MEKLTVTHNGLTFQPTAAELTAMIMARLKGDAPILPTPVDPRIAPAIGAVWEGQGGIYAGLSMTDEGCLYHLILADTERDHRLDWRAALEWAKDLRKDGFEDWTLPSRHDGIVLFKNLKDRFEQNYHWLSEETQDSGYAWYQHFGHGNQNWYYRYNPLRARAVRRLKI